MSEEDLEVLITLDDPGDEPVDDTFNHLQAQNTLADWLGQWFPAGYQLDQRPEAVSHSDADRVTFGQGDWTCTLSRLTVPMNDSMNGLNGNMIQPADQNFEIEVCIVTCSKQGEIVEQKVFYDLAGMQKQFGVR